MRGTETADEVPVKVEPEAAVPARHGRRKWLVLTVVLVVLAGIGGTVAWWFRQRGPSQPSISEAVGRFRSSSTPAVDGLPRPGVYLYSGTGEEKLSFLATHQSQDGLLPGTVKLQRGGCWTFTIQFNSFHRETWNRCVVGDRLVERGNTTDQKFDFGPLSQSEHTEIVCSPPTVLIDPAASPGDRSTLRCRGHSQTTKASMTQRGRITFVGRSTVLVGKTRVPALHFSQNLTITGDQTGAQHEEVWLAPGNGLPLRERRTIRVESPAPAPLNQVTYTERGGWVLTSLTPRT